MRYALIYLLLLFAFSGCSLFANSSRTLETSIIEIDQLTLTQARIDSLKALGITIEPISMTKALLIKPAPKKGKTKIKYKNVGNDYSKVKDTGNYTDKSTLKDKSKAKPKTKADIIGDNNRQEKAARGEWVKWACIALIVLVLGYVFFPLLSGLFRKKLDN